MLEKRLQERVRPRAQYGLLTSVPGRRRDTRHRHYSGNRPDRSVCRGRTLCLPTPAVSIACARAIARRKAKATSRMATNIWPGPSSKRRIFARRHCAEANRFHARKKAKTNNVVATKALAHKLARASYHILKEGKPSERNALLCLTDDDDPGQPGTVTGVAANCTELDAGSPSPAAVKADRTHRKPSGDWRRHMSSHGTARFSLGYGAVPTFFWGGKAARAAAPVGPMLDPNGCLARFRSSSFSHKLKKRTRFEYCCSKKPMTALAAWRRQKNIRAP